MVFKSVQNWVSVSDGSYTQDSEFSEHQQRNFIVHFISSFWKPRKYTLHVITEHSYEYTANGFGALWADNGASNVSKIAGAHRKISSFLVNQSYSLP